MRFFIDYLWDFSETPHQQWAVFTEERDKTVLYFKSLHGKPAAERVCNRAKYAMQGYIQQQTLVVA